MDGRNLARELARKPQAVAMLLAIPLGYLVGAAVVGGGLLLAVVSGVLITALIAYGSIYVRGVPLSLVYVTLPFAYIPVIGSKISFGRFVILACLLGLLLREFSSRQPLPSLGRITSVLALFVIWSLVCAFVSPEEVLARRLVVSYVVNTLLVALILEWGVRDWVSVERWIRVAVVLGSISAGLALLQWLFGEAFSPWLYLPASERLEETSEAYRISSRLSGSGLFAYRAENVAFLLLPWGVAFALLLSSGLTRARWWRRGLTILPLLGLLLAAFVVSGARSGLAMPAICCAVVLALRGHRRRARALLLSGIMVATAMALVSSPYFNTLSERFGRSTLGEAFTHLAAEDRSHFFAPALSAILESPVVGMGLGGYVTQYPEAHNILLDVGTEMGLVGVVFWVGVLLYAGRKYLYVLRDPAVRLDPTRYALIVGMFGTFVALLAQGIVGFGFLSLRVGFPPFVVLLVAPDVLSRLCRHAETPGDTGDRPGEAASMEALEISPRC